MTPVCIGLFISMKNHLTESCKIVQTVTWRLAGAAGEKVLRSPQGWSVRATSLQEEEWGMVAYLILQLSDNNLLSLGLRVFFFSPENIRTKFSAPVKFSKGSIMSANKPGKIYKLQLRTAT